jgi:hypothetical protein
VSIGACYFDVGTGTIGNTFYSKVSLDSSVKAGLKIDASTVLWWMQQSEEARAEFIDNDKAPLLTKVLADFTSFCRQCEGGWNKLEIWGNGAAFDNVILRSAFEAVGMDVPWRWTHDMCFRTLKNIPTDVTPPKFKGTKHNALADAIYQAEYAILLLR